jgi:hypothetical protein
MVPEDPRHARPAPKGPDPFHWRAVRFLGLAIMAAALALYFSGLMGPFPLVARQYLTGALFVVGALVFFFFGWLFRWILEG